MKEYKRCDYCGESGEGIKIIYSKKEQKYLCQKHYNQIRNGRSLHDYNLRDANDYITTGDITEIILKNKFGEETGRAIIDTEDLEKVIKYKWHLTQWGYATYGKGLFMQRVILDCYEKDKIPDHINLNTLDNRKCNLRIANKSQNACNTKNSSTNTSGVRGVNYHKGLKKWRAYITKNYKTHNLIWTKNKDEAIKIRLMAEKELYGEFAPQKDLFEQYGV